MKILAIETATEICSVALLHGESMFERAEPAGQRHSERVLEMVSQVLHEAQTDIRALDAVAFGEGPGSFTGLRIACGVAQGLALGSDLAVTGVSTLLAVAETVGSTKAIVAMDARMGEIYHAAFIKTEGAWAVISPPCVCKPEAAPMLDGNGWDGCGNGFSVYGSALLARYGATLESIFAEAMPSAAAIARLAEPRLRAGQHTGPEGAAPLYVRNNVALKSHER